MTNFDKAIIVTTIVLLCMCLCASIILGFGFWEFVGLMIMTNCISMIIYILAAVELKKI